MPCTYYYTDEEVGFPFPGPDADRLKYFGGIPRFVWYEWPGFETTTDPNRADVFVVRQRFSKLTEAQMRGLPYLRGNEERHVFFDLNDHFIKTFPDIQGIYFRSCCTEAILAVNPNTVLWPWAVVESLVHDYIPMPAGGFKYDVVYQGRIYPWNDTMIGLLENTNLRSHLVRVSTFWPHIRDSPDPSERARAAKLKEVYLTTMSEGRLILCPMTIGTGAVRMRLYDAMAMGRFQVHFNDRAVLPFNDKINWDECMLRLPLSAIRDIHKILPAWLAQHSDEDIIMRGKYAREMWKKWLAPEQWGHTAGIMVRERLGL